MKVHSHLLDGVLLNPGGGFEEERFIWGHFVKDDTGDG